MALRFAIACSVVILAFQGLAVAQKSGAVAPPQIKTSITIDSNTLAADQAATVTVTIQNLSGAELEGSSICSFHLRNLSKEAVARKHEVVGDRYWGPVDVSTGKPAELTIIDPAKEKQGIVVGRAPKLSLRFAKDETKTFKIDLTNLVWNDVMSSLWPHETLFKVVPKGTYALSFQMSNKGVNLKSNEVEVSINSDQKNSPASLLSSVSSSFKSVITI